MSAIRTPDDEVNKPGYFYPPFREGWWYQGATYAGHSDASVDWNRRTKNGGWLEDTGDPVLAAADGTVVEVDPHDGVVMLKHWNDTYRTEYRHMTGPFPKVGDKVQRGDRIGSIGNVAGDGRSFGAHLHHVHYRGGKRVQQSFYGKPVPVSVIGSDSKPASWKAPDPVMMLGPAPKATWESAFKEAKAALDKAQSDLAVAAAKITDQAKRIDELEQAPAADCHEAENTIADLKDRIDKVKALVTL